MIHFKFFSPFYSTHFNKMLCDPFATNTGGDGIIGQNGVRGTGRQGGARPTLSTLPYFLTKSLSPNRNLAT